MKLVSVMIVQDLLIHELLWIINDTRFTMIYPWLEQLKLKT